MRTATIIGAGIAGLTAAIALQRKGWHCTIHEAAETVRSAGAGITLSSNAMQALKHLGISEKVKEGGLPIRRLIVQDETGRALSDLDPGFLPEPMIAIHRSVLHSILLDAVGEEHVVTNSAVDDVATLRGDVIIGADGINSRVRSRLIKGTEPVYSGYTCWRGLVHIPGYISNVASETWGRHGRVGIVPIGNDNIYWFICVNAEREAPWVRRMTVDDLAERFASYPSPLPEIIRSTSASDILLNDISDLKPLKQWVFGKVALIGDAAHATTPNLGQGACQAIEDAVILADRLASISDISNALVAYEQARMPRATMIVKRSRRLGRIAQITHPVLATVRNAVLKATPVQTKLDQMQQICTFNMLG